MGGGQLFFEFDKKIVLRAKTESNYEKRRGFAIFMKNK